MGSTSRRKRREQAKRQQATEAAANNTATTPMPYMPVPIDGLTAVLGASRNDLRVLLPPQADIPPEFNNWQNPWCKLVSGWFFKGLGGWNGKPKPGIDQRAAIRHIAAILRSFEPSHEHKEAGCAYLMSLWFETH